MSDGFADCPACDGGGATVEAEPVCCGRVDRHGACWGDCANYVERQTPCVDCGGEGRVPAPPNPYPDGMSRPDGTRQGDRNV